MGFAWPDTKRPRAGVGLLNPKKDYWSKDQEDAKKIIGRAAAGELAEGPGGCGRGREDPRFGRVEVLRAREVAVLPLVHAVWRFQRRGFSPTISSLRRLPWSAEWGSSPGHGVNDQDSNLDQVDLSCYDLHAGPADDEAKFGFQRPEMYKGSLANIVDPPPKLLGAALKARKSEIPIKTRLTMCGGCNGIECSDGDVLIFPEMIKYEYGYATPDDVPEVLEQHIGQGKVIERLRRMSCAMRHCLCLRRLVVFCALDYLFFCLDQIT
ncbi:hypothetical protein NL676_034599 [Syzygium grande]|nr:hypothetical protein NL676_034599 [Syzygium grande]